MAKARQCDKCGKFYIPSYTHKGEWLNREVKPRYIVYESNSRGGFEDHPHDLCAECQKELDEYLAEFFKSQLVADCEVIADIETCGNKEKFTTYKAVLFPKDAVIRDIDEWSDKE